MNSRKIKGLFQWMPKSYIQARDGLQSGKYPFYTSSQEQKKWLDEAFYSGEALIFGKGGTASIHYESGRFSVSSDCLVAECIREDINVKYIYYYLKTNIHLLERGFRGAGLKHISKNYINNLDIKYPTLEEQNRLVTVLDKLQAIIDSRSESIDLLDNLLQSVYLQKFGVKNPHFNKWQYTSISSVTKSPKGKIRTGPFGSSLTHDQFKEIGDVAVLGIDNAVDNIFRWKKRRFITIAEFENFKNYVVQPRDVIITLMGTIGRSAVIPADVGLAINTKHLAAITLDESRINPYYLSYSFHSNDHVLHQLKARSRGSVMDGLNLGIIKQIQIKEPPIEEQNEFEKVYKVIQLNKNQFLDSRNLMETLLQSFSYIIFTGQRSILVDVEVESLINNINLDMPDETNDISSITNDRTYLQNLIDKLNTRDFDNLYQYDKALYIAFRLLKSGDGILEQYYDVNFEEIRIKLTNK